MPSLSEIDEPPAFPLDLHLRLDGAWREGEDRIEVVDPQDETCVGVVARATEETARRAVAAATSGSEAAKRMAVHRRMQVLNGAADRVAEARSTFAQVIAREGVKTIREARAEVDRCVTTLRLSAEEARRVGGKTVSFGQHPSGEQRTGYYDRVPMGVVVAITPYNDPLNLVAHKVGPAFAGGNAIIVKPDPRTPLSALLLCRAFYESGLPDGVLQCLPGAGDEVGSALVADSRVDMVSFTGGTNTGAAVAAEAGIKTLAMELGSNSPVIVMPDADLESAVQASVSGAFSAAGQNCLHVQRLLVHEHVYDDLMPRFFEATEALTTGNKRSEDTDVGPMIDEDAARRVERLVNEARAAGAVVRTGGKRDGPYYAPTIIEDVPKDCALANEEVFGPVTIVRSVASLEDAVHAANDVPYGLQAGIFTQDIDVAHRAIEALEYGAVMVNDSSDYRIDAMPFGGRKKSGLGREGVRFALEEMTEPKLVCFNFA